jgi:hypothetical protein
VTEGVSVGEADGVREGVRDGEGERVGERVPELIGEREGELVGDGSMQPPPTSVFSTTWEPPLDQAPPPVGHVLVPLGVHTSMASSSDVNSKLNLTLVSGAVRQKASL